MKIKQKTASLLRKKWFLATTQGEALFFFEVGKFGLAGC
jgi:hypothetical protein